MKFSPLGDYRQIHEAVGKMAGLLRVGADGSIIDANATFCALLAGERADFIGRPRVALNGDVVDPDYVRHLAEGTGWRGVQTLVSPGGGKVTVRLVAHRVDGGRGGTAELVLAVSEAELRTMHDARGLRTIASGRGMLECAPDGTILDVNNNFLRAVGYRRDELIGQHHRVLAVAGEAEGEAYRQFWERLRAGEHFVGEIARRHRDGHTVWLAESYNGMRDAAGAVTSLMIFATDVTDRVRAVETIKQALGGLAAGALDVSVPEGLPAPFDAIAADLNGAVGALRTTLRQVRESSSVIDGSLREIRAAADDLARRTEGEAASLEQSAAALAQLDKHLRATADEAKQARETAAATAGMADESNRLVSEAVAAMQAIESSSSEIAQIIDLIEEVGFQTNLLALNAGVEAARAGEAGRGFAVVASEVRALAQRSSDAARRITPLILGSRRQVTEGVALVARTGEALQGIFRDVEAMNGRIGEMAAAIAAQSDDIGAINSAIGYLDQAIQQNAAMAEEANAATATLAGQAEALSGIVGRFRFASGAAKPDAPPLLRLVRSEAS